MDIKKGILLQLFSGSQKDFDDSGRGKFRSDTVFFAQLLFTRKMIIDCLERLVSEMMYPVLSEMLNSTENKLLTYLFVHLYNTVTVKCHWNNISLRLACPFGVYCLTTQETLLSTGIK